MIQIPHLPVNNLLMECEWNVDTIICKEEIKV